jgi:hypothetical protein
MLPNIVVVSVAHLTHVGEVLALNLVPETASSKTRSGEYLSMTTTVSFHMFSNSFFTYH